MGLDGGTYITRSDVLRGQSWELNKAENSRSTRGGAVTGTHKKAKLDPKLERQTKWSTCALSGQPLQPPLAADMLGSLYNREAVLEFLLGRAGHFADKDAEHRYVNQLRASGDAFDHLQAKRDVFNVFLSLETEKAAEARETSAAIMAYRCPITDLPCQVHPFSALVKCGHVFSQRAIQQMDSSCGICGQAFSDASVVAINGSKEEMAELARRMAESKLLLKAKQGKKRKLLQLKSSPES